MTPIQSQITLYTLEGPCIKCLCDTIKSVIICVKSIVQMLTKWVQMLTKWFQMIPNDSKWYPNVPKWYVDCCCKLYQLFSMSVAKNVQTWMSSHSNIHRYRQRVYLSPTHLRQNCGACILRAGQTVPTTCSVAPSHERRNGSPHQAQNFRVGTAPQRQKGHREQMGLVRIAETG